MSQPKRVALAHDHYFAWEGAIAEGDSQQLAFTPLQMNVTGPPPGASDTAVPAFVAHEILISNPGTDAILVTPVPIQAQGYGVWGPFRSTMEPVWVDPTTFPAVTGTNSITVPAGAIAFPIRVRSYGVTISSPNGDTTPSVVASGPLSLLA